MEPEGSWNREYSRFMKDMAGKSMTFPDGDDSIMLMNWYRVIKKHGDFCNLALMLSEDMEYNKHDLMPSIRNKK